jgi:hypothetical protein
MQPKLPGQFAGPLVLDLTGPAATRVTISSDGTAMRRPASSTPSTSSREGTMFSYFPGNYVWSSAFNLALAAGGQLNQMDRWLAPLRDIGPEPDTDAWTKAWDSMGEEQSRHAAAERADGYLQAASARYFHAATYHLTGERQTPPGPAKTRSYTAALDAFARGVELMAHPIERVEVDSPDGVLPGYLIPSGTGGPAPVVIFYNGLDVTKEILYGIIGDQFSRRGIACLVIDTPGTGEPLRLRGVASRPDYEVPTAAIVDCLQTRPDVDPAGSACSASAWAATTHRAAPRSRRGSRRASRGRRSGTTARPGSAGGRRARRSPLRRSGSCPGSWARTRWKPHWNASSSGRSSTSCRSSPSRC